MLVIDKLYGLAMGLKEISGRLDKEEYLKKHADNSNWTKYLFYTLDSLQIYGLADKKLKKALTNVRQGKAENITEFTGDIFELFKYLSKNNTGRDIDAIIVANFINNLPEKYHEWLIESFTKSFKMGVTAKTVNKALKAELISEFEIQRGHSYIDHTKKFKDEDKLISEKLNGVRGIAYINDGNVRVISRQNKEIEGLKDIIAEMSHLPNGVYEGELTVKDRHKYKLRDVLQETMKIVASKSTDKKLDYNLFDYLTFEEFAHPEKSRNYFERKHYLNAVIKPNLENVSVIETLYLGKDEEKIYSLLEEIVANGGEGLMANLDKQYKKGKTNHILKVKKKYTSDLRVIALEEGKGKNKGTLGAFVLDYKGNTLNCGIMPDNIRNQVWADQEVYIGAIVEVEHEQETGNQKNDLLSVEYPVFVQIRTDKDEVSYAHE